MVALFDHADEQVVRIRAASRKGWLPAFRDADTQTPERLSLPVLAALCDIFECTDLPGDDVEILRHPRLERAIGVIYQPRTERQSH
ncbi:helix-turn-helix domain-containing protein [Nocardia pneumoniae]|uniref:helix-turn-helix domain-containing protein n=1 Tax=Nocardia pneumoniae TaxID=228601 RepID=UPI00059478A6